MPGEIQEITFTAPGSLGLNLQRSGQIQDFRWLVESENCVIDKNNLIASRLGSTRILSSAVSGTVSSVFEYIDSNGNTLLIFAAGNKIYKDNGDGTSTDITGTITTPTADNWKFVNFNGKCVGFQSGHAPIVLATISSSFADIVLSGTQQPTSNVDEVLSAFGRIWVIDGTNLKYSDALNETAWNNLFDLTTVWISGMDVGTALAEFNGFLIVFGKNSITVWNNPWIPTGGGTIDTAGMSLVENIQGIGCIARDSVQKVGTDILFLSNTGVRSLGRTIQEKSMPDRDLSKNIRDHLLSDVSNESSPIKSIFAPKEGYYLLSLPSQSEIYCFDTRVQLEDGSFRVTKWNLEVYSFAVTLSNVLYFGQTSGWISKYSGNKDNISYNGTGGSSYDMHIHTGWHYLHDEIKDLSKILKKFSSYIGSALTDSLTFHWATDYNPNFSQAQVSFTSQGSVAQYNISQYNIDTYAATLEIDQVLSSITKSGRVFQFGWHIQIDGGAVFIQNFSVQFKIGKRAL